MFGKKKHYLSDAEIIENMRKLRELDTQNSGAENSAIRWAIERMALCLVRRHENSK